MTTTLGYRDYAADREDSGDAGGAWVKDGSGATPDQASGFEASNLGDGDEGSRWKTADATGAKSVVRRFEGPRVVGAPVARGLNLPGGSLIRSYAGSPASMRAVVLDNVNDYIWFDDSNLTPDSAVTFEVKFRVTPNEIGAAEIQIAHYGDNTATADTTYDWRLRVQGSSGEVQGIVSRYDEDADGADTRNFTSLGDVTNGEWTYLAIVISGTTMTGYAMRAGETSLTSETALTVEDYPTTPPTAETLQIGRFGSVYGGIEVAMARLWSRALPEAELLAFAHRLRSSTDEGLEIAWQFIESDWGNFSTDAIADDSGNSRPGTISGQAASAWAVRPNPWAAWDSGWRPVAPLLDRPRIRLAATGQTLQTGLSGNTTPSFTFLMGVRRQWYRATGAQQAYWGTAFGALTNDFEIQVQGDALRFVVNRGSAANNLDTPALTVGADYKVALTVDGTADSAELFHAASGAALASVATDASIPAPPGLTSIRLHLRGLAEWGIFGPILLVSRVLTVAEMEQAFAWGWAPDADTELYYPMVEGSGSTVTNYGNQATMNMTLTSGSWVAGTPNPGADVLSGRARSYRGTWAYAGTAAEVDEVALEIYTEPFDVDGFVSARHLHALETQALTWGLQNVRVDTIGAETAAGLYGWRDIPRGAALRRLSGTLWLTDAEAELFQRLYQDRELIYLDPPKPDSLLASEKLRPLYGWIGRLSFDEFYVIEGGEVGRWTYGVEIVEAP